MICLMKLVPKNSWYQITCLAIYGLSTSHESLHKVITWSHKPTCQTKAIISPLAKCLYPANFARWWLTLRDSYPGYSTLWSRGFCRITWKNKAIVSPLPKCPWLPNLVKYRPTMIKSHNTLITWSCEITRQTKIIISALIQCLWLSKVVGWWLTVRGSHSWEHMTRENFKNLKKLKSVSPLL